jgi:dTDP-4-dehydrorhamnose reductase
VASNPKILVLGAGGMAGHVITLYLRENGYSVDTLSARNKVDNETFILDVTNKNKLEAFLDNHDYDIVINSIGILVKQSDERKDLSTYLNSYLPHFLEYRFAKTSTKIIHLSTDCVFSGKNAPYTEDAPYDGELFYDRTKALGEIINTKDLTFRMSIIGPDMQESGMGLFNWFYKQTGEVSGYTHAIWNGITTIELAKAIEASIKQNLTGLYHLVPDTNISKFELLRIIKDVFHRSDINLHKDSTVTIDKTLVNTRKDFDHKLPDYPLMIVDMRNWVLEHSSYYPHYSVA